MSASRDVRRCVLVTGGAGFIGSALVRRLLSHTSYSVVTLDRLTYAGNLESLAGPLTDARHSMEVGDIGDVERVRDILDQYRPDGLFHLAAETHVDRSIDAPHDFMSTNVIGTFVLLEETRRYLLARPPASRTGFRFVHVSTDEVYGSLGEEGRFDEGTAYAPRSPYAASKAASDHLARAWHHTYDVPVMVTNCSNNYGPRQFPEKLIPLIILHALDGEPLPVYGKGEQIRDWLYVEDHAAGLVAALERGRTGETYVFGGDSERRNVDVVRSICAALDELRPDPAGGYARLLRFVTDRPGHDYRYAVDNSKARSELGWEPVETFESGLRSTVRWYLENEEWWRRVRSGAYRGERLGLGTAH